jgi:hypothetical protein
MEGTSPNNWKETDGRDIESCCGAFAKALSSYSYPCPREPTSRKIRQPGRVVFPQLLGNPTIDDKVGFLFSMRGMRQRHEERGSPAPLLLS